MDRGVPTEAVLHEMRISDPPVQYLVGTPKGRLTRLEKALVAKPWQDARPGVRVKLLPQDAELYVFAQSADRVAKERAIRRRQLKWLWARLKEIAAMDLTREELLMKLGAARAAYPVESGPSICSRRDAFARIVSLDDVPIAGGLVVGGEPEQRFERNMAIEATIITKHEFVEIRVNVFAT